MANYSRCFFFSYFAPFRLHICRKYETRPLVFAPNIPIFKNLTDQVSKQLEFKQEPVGVDNDDELQRTMTNNDTFAGIYFHHSHVK